MPECAEDDTFALQQVPFLKVANDRVLLLTMSESSLMECQNSVALTSHCSLLKRVLESRTIQWLRLWLAAFFLLVFRVLSS